MNLMDFYPCCGVYKFTNKINNKVYIGQSKAIYKRWHEHIDHFLRGKHTNKEMQQEMQEYGLSVFDAEILCECEAEKLNELEIYYMKQARREGHQLYNLDTQYNRIDS